VNHKKVTTYCFISPHSGLTVIMWYTLGNKMRFWLNHRIKFHPT